MQNKRERDRGGQGVGVPNQNLKFAIFEIKMQDMWQDCHKSNGMSLFGPAGFTG